MVNGRSIVGMLGRLVGFTKRNTQAKDVHSSKWDIGCKPRTCLRSFRDCNSSVGADQNLVTWSKFWSRKLTLGSLKRNACASQVAGSQDRTDEDIGQQGDVCGLWICKCELEGSNRPRNSF